MRRVEIRQRVNDGEGQFTIVRVISFETVVGRDGETGNFAWLPIAGLQRDRVDGPTGAGA